GRVYRQPLIASLDWHAMSSRNEVPPTDYCYQCRDAQADASRQVNAINRPLVVSISVCPSGAASSFDGNRLLECTLPTTHSLVTRAIHLPGGVTEVNAQPLRA